MQRAGEGRERLRAVFVADQQPLRSAAAPVAAAVEYQPGGGAGDEVVGAQGVLPAAVLDHDAAVGRQPPVGHHRAAGLRIALAGAGVEAERTAVLVHLLLALQVVVADDGALGGAAALGHVLPVAVIKRPREGVGQHVERGVETHQRQCDTFVHPVEELLKATAAEYGVQQHALQPLVVDAFHVPRLLLTTAFSQFPYYNI